VFVEREVRDEPLESAVFLFHLAQAAQFTDAEMGVLLLLGVEGLLGDPELSAEVTDGSPALRLPEGVDDLLFRES
jgi:hypothetical protein